MGYFLIHPHRRDQLLLPSKVRPRPDRVRVHEPLSVDSGRARGDLAADTRPDQPTSRRTPTGRSPPTFRSPFQCVFRQISRELYATFPQRPGLEG